MSSNNMVNEKAHCKGNAAFKAADYAAAIGHYTAAILANRNDCLPTESGCCQNEDAERDCTTVLELSKDNVKGLFRRGQARVALGKLLDARKDFSDVLLLQPSNTAAQEEMKKLSLLMQQVKAKNPKTAASLEAATATARRLVPIKIIDSSEKVVQTSTAEPGPSGISDSKSSSVSETALDTKRSSDTLEAVSSRSLKSPTTSESAIRSTPNSPSRTSSSPKHNSFSEARAARENTRPSRVGGGICKASGERTIFATNGVESRTVLRDNDKEQQPASRFPIPQQSLEVVPQDRKMTYLPPSTLFEFSKSWSSLSSTEERWQYLNTIEPSSLPKPCQTSLEPSLLVSILEAFLATLSGTRDLSEIKQQILAYMEGFAQLPRFGTVVLFLSKKREATSEANIPTFPVSPTTQYQKRNTLSGMMPRTPPSEIQTRDETPCKRRRIQGDGKENLGTNIKPLASVAERIADLLKLDGTLLRKRKVDMRDEV